MNVVKMTGFGSERGSGGQGPFRPIHSSLVIVSDFPEEFWHTQKLLNLSFIVSVREAVMNPLAAWGSHR